MTKEDEGDTEIVQTTERGWTEEKGSEPVLRKEEEGRGWTRVSPFFRMFS